MKTYKTWEAIKMIEENRELKFEDKNRRILASENDGSLVCRYVGTRSLIDLLQSWTLVQKPVTYMEAINSNKLIKADQWDGYHQIDWVLRQCGHEIPSDALILINGKWFIESEDTM